VTVGAPDESLVSPGQSVLDGSIKVSGAASAADIEAALDVQYTARDVGGGPVVAKLRIADHDGRATVTGTATGLSAEDAKLDAEFPARVDARAFRATFDMAAPIKGSLTWHGDIKPLWQLLAYDQHALAGQADLDLAVSGSIAQPRIAGGLKLTKASYENFASGTAMRDLDASITAEDTDSFAVTLSGSDTDGGKITAKGTFSRGADGHWAVDAGGDLDRFHVLRRDDATAATTGHITYKGPLTSGTLSGRLQVVRSELRLGATYVPEIPLLRAKMSLAQDAAKPSPIKLDVTLAIDDVIRVEGKGLEAFWRGALHAQGTLDTPDISGTLTLARGTFTFLGQTFDLTQGTITFTGGGKIDPELSITASKASGTVTATVNVTGPASHPNIALSSTPVMPQDEVLAQLLFRKGTGQLGPLESLQLASAAADLAGLSQGGLTGMLRRTFGLDIVSFGGKSGDSVVLGHQISSSLYVGVEQSVATSSERQLVVEWRLSRSLSIESTTDQQTGADIGLVWRKDY
jgi:translocation and assembly module TamB